MSGIPQRLILIFVAGFAFTELNLSLRYEFAALASSSRLAAQLAIGFVALILFQLLSNLIPPLGAFERAQAATLNELVANPEAAASPPAAERLALPDCEPPYACSNGMLVLVDTRAAADAHAAFVLIPHAGHLGAILLAAVVAMLYSVARLLSCGWRPWLRDKSQDSDARLRPGSLNAALLVFSIQRNDAGAIYNTLAESLLYRRSIMVTLSSSKVYAGYVLAVPNFRDARAKAGMCRLLPTMSGYRNAQQQVEFNTFYDETRSRLEALDPPLDESDDFLSVCFALEDIALITRFDPQVYDAFNADVMPG